jgi:transketolase
MKVLAAKLRRDTVEIVRRAGGGHIGGDLSEMDILAELYFREMNITPANQDDPDRDRFVLSKGHSVEAYYAVLAEKGFFPLEDVLTEIGTVGTKFIGHPNNKLPGIEMNSGSLGHGLPVCVGMAVTVDVRP